MHEKADVNIGKRGLSPEVIEELKRRLDGEDVIKVRVNRNVYRQQLMDIDDFARRLAETLQADVIDVRGRSIVIAKKK